MKKFILILALFFIGVTTTGLSAANEKTAFFLVKDSVTHDPIPGVAITIVGVQVGTTTDLDGNAVLDVTRYIGRYYDVSCIGYESQSHELLNYNNVKYCIDLVPTK